LMLNDMFDRNEVCYTFVPEFLPHPEPTPAPEQTPCPF
jgi:hypothetical protein